MEYLVLNQNFVIQELSYGVERFADSEHSSSSQLAIGQDARASFPELIGLEANLAKVLQGQNGSFELKGIARFLDAKPPIYFDLFIVTTQDENSCEENLVLFFEEVTARMVLEQTLAQRTNEANLLLSELASAKNYVDQIITSMADALIVTNVSGKIKTINRAAQDLFGYDAADLIGQPITKLIDSEELISEINNTCPLGANKFLQNIEASCLAKTGARIPISFSCSILQTDKLEERNFIYVGRDITAHKQAEEKLETARISAEAASHAKSLFLANMSHEIRTPMNAILGMTQLLRESYLTTEQRDFVENVHMSGETLLTLINEILDLSKLEAGEMQLENLAFDLHSCVEQVADLLAPQAHGKGLAITTLIDPQVPITIQGDSHRLRQVLTNLVGNAIKFTTAGEVIIQVERPQEKSLLFSVIDTGIGIAPEHQSKLFAPFSQVDASTTRKYGGTGLGLAICSQIVRLMGGEIGIESTEGQGTRFWLTMPVFIAAENYATFQPLAFILHSASVGHRVLIVSNHAATRKAIALQATNWGIHIDEADTTANAWESLQNSLHKTPPYNLLLIDWQMPDHDGITLGQQIKANSELADIPLVLLVNTSQRHIGQQCLTQGFTDYLVKPIKISRLSEVLSKALNLERDPSVAEILPLAVAKAETLSQPSSPLKIMVAEDNPVNQKVALKFLERLGYGADVAKNGAEVLQLLEITHYDLILMDCQMPVLDGYATTQEIRRRQNSDRRTIIVAMTANAMKQDRDRCLEAGMDDYLSKPVGKEQIQAVLNRWTK